MEVIGHGTALPAVFPGPLAGMDTVAKRKTLCSDSN